MNFPSPSSWYTPFFSLGTIFMEKYADKNCLFSKLALWNFLSPFFGQELRSGPTNFNQGHNTRTPSNDCQEIMNDHIGNFNLKSDSQVPCKIYYNPMNKAKELAKICLKFPTKHTHTHTLCRCIIKFFSWYHLNGEIRQ